MLWVDFNGNPGPAEFFVQQKCVVITYRFLGAYFEISATPETAKHC